MVVFSKRRRFFRLNVCLTMPKDVWRSCKLLTYIYTFPIFPTIKRCMLQNGESMLHTLLLSRYTSNCSDHFVWFFRVYWSFCSPPGAICKEMLAANYIVPVVFKMALTKMKSIIRLLKNSTEQTWKKQCKPT